MRAFKTFFTLRPRDYYRKGISCFLVLTLLLSATFAFACKKSEYPDATKTVPSTWTTYRTGNLTFSFEAGFSAVSNESSEESAASDESSYLSASDFSALLTEVGAAAGYENAFSTMQIWHSPLRDRNTVDYFIAGYFTTESVVTAQDLEAIMTPLNALSDDRDLYEQIKFLQLTRIRLFGDVEALTFCVRLTTPNATTSSENKYTVLQIALVPHETTLYTFIYADYTTSADNEYLERFLSSLNIA